MRTYSIRCLFLALGLFGTIGSLSAQTWSRTYGDQDHGPYLALRPLVGYDYIGVGLIQDDDDLSLDAMAHRIDDDGRHVWRRRYVEGAFNTKFEDVAVSGSYTFACGEWDDRPWLVSLDRDTGAIVWQQTTLALDGGYTCVRPLSSNEAVAVGYVRSPDGDLDILATRFNHRGDIIWQRTFGGTSGYDRAQIVVPLANGDFLIAGNTSSSSLGFRDLYLARLNDRGDLLWHRAQGTDQFEGAFVAACEAPNGDLLVAYDVSNRLHVARMNPTGHALWEREYVGVGYRWREMQATAEGGFVIVGDKSVEDQRDDMWLARFDGEGGVEWQKTFGGPEDDCGFSIERSHDGGYVVGGFTRSYAFGVSWSWGIKLDRKARLDEECAFVQEHRGHSVSVTTESSSMAMWMGSPLTLADTHAAPSIATPSPWEQCSDLCRITPRSYGEGLRGSGGFTPEIWGSDGYCSGGSAFLEIDAILSGTVDFLWLGIGDAALPFRGGTLLVDPSQYYYLIVTQVPGNGTPGAGTLRMPLNSNMSRLAGTDLFFQGMFLDPGAIQGVSMSNGMKLEFRD